MFRSLVPAVIAVAALALPAQAAQVDLSSLVNANIRGYTQGVNYPIGGQSVSIGGISFALDNSCGRDALCAIQTSGAQTYTIPVNVAGVGTIYTIINSANGTSGANNGSLTFNGTNGATATFDLIQGDNIRDHYFGGFNNVAANIYATAAYENGAVVADGPGRAHLDVQRFVLPTAFSTETLTSITFTSTGRGGQPFLAAATTAAARQVSALPEPSSWAMMVGGFGVIGGASRARRRRPATA